MYESPVVQPPLPVADFERDFNGTAAREHMVATWHHSIIFSVLYVVSVHAGQRYMSTRPAFNLRSILVVWSATLAVFSIAGALRMSSYFLYVSQTYGMHATLCSPEFYVHSPSGFWSYYFAISKAFEFGDTAFIVLRKQKLAFLHWYHHITVCMYCWFNLSVGSPTGMPFGTMNYIIHSLMYTYYTLKALRVNIPRQVAMMVTFLQLIQMIVGMGITGVMYYYRWAGVQCPEENITMLLALLMYTSYMVLFAHFFYNAYIKKRAKSKLGQAATPVNGAANGHINGHANGVSNGCRNESKNQDNGDINANGIVHSKSE